MSLKSALRHSSVEAVRRMYRTKRKASAILRFLKKTARRLSRNQAKKDIISQKND